MRSKIPLAFLYVAVKTERNFVRLTGIAAKCKRVGRELFLFCAGGCFTGLGIGFFIFLRLGVPATHELTGYVVGLFLMAGLKFGFSLWLIRSLAVPLMGRFRQSSSRGEGPN